MSHLVIRMRSRAIAMSHLGYRTYLDAIHVGRYHSLCRRSYRDAGWKELKQ